MEDAATAEISRTQLWQWLHFPTFLPGGNQVTSSLYQELKTNEIEKIRKLIGEETFTSGRFDEAIQLFDELVLSDTLEEFLTIPAYHLLC